MANLDLHIVKRKVNGQDVTVTCIGKKHGPSNNVVFYNDSDAELTVTFQPAGTMDKDKITVPKKNGNGKVHSGSVNFKAGKGLGTKVKYTATIAGAASEDPIIIID